MKLSNYVFGIHSNVKPGAGFTDGHAWLTINTLIGKVSFAKSFWIVAR